MDKMEILKLALAHAPDPKSAMELAREMEAFLKGPPPAPRWVAETITAMSVPEQNTEKTLSGKPRKNRHPWTQKDLINLQDLINKNYAIQDMPLILGRSLASIESAISRLKRGEYSLDWLPSEKTSTLTQKVNAGKFPGHTS